MKFLDRSINLGPDPALNVDGSVRLAGLDNHNMGTVFEELIRRFNEENIVLGSTLSQDAHMAKRFDFMLCNPPCGLR